MQPPGGEGDRPTGTVTFLFTDIEGSTRLWADDHDTMAASLMWHDDILRATIGKFGGYVFSTGGDGVAAVFARAADALAAAEEAQRALGVAEWPGPALRVRMGLHVGEAEERDGDYFGPVVNTASRVQAAGHGGQVLLTETVRQVSGVPSKDLGVHRLRDVGAMHLYQLGDDDFPALRIVEDHPSNLPTRPTRLLGRDEDIAAVRRLLGRERWVTLMATGGSGKTRLAIAVGVAELPHRPDGVWFVDLTAVVTDDEVPTAIATSLRLTLRSGDVNEQVLAYLLDKRLLMILDNCEHVLDGCATFADRLLATACESVVLATSRARLAVDGEQIAPLSTLPTGDVGAAGVRLFAERAAALDPSFRITDANAESVIALCTHLDGLPLAIELAAARIAVMTPADLLAGISDRFELLSGGPRRVRTLEATLDWSYDLLSPDEQLVLRSLGVFVDGFDLEAVAAVAGVGRGIATTTIDSLVSKSLVVRADRDEQARFGLLETVKAYAERRLSDDDARAARGRHLEHFAALAADRSCNGFSELRLGIRLRPDRGNLVVGFEWAIADHRRVDAARLIADSYAAFLVDGAGMEAITLIERAMAACERDDRSAAYRLQVALGHCLVWINEWTGLHRTATALVDSPDPALRTFGGIVDALATGLSDGAAAVTKLAGAADELVIARASAPGLTTEIVAGYLPWIGARLAAGRGDHAAALDGTRAWLAVQQATDFYSTGATRATKHAAVCEILTGRPSDALTTVAWLDQFDFVGADTDDIRALAHLALGQRDRAEERIRIHTARAITARLVGEACDSALLLAALARADGEIGVACDLLLQMGMGQEPATIVYSGHLASLLGIGDEHASRQLTAAMYLPSSPEGPSGSHVALAAVRRELDRRGWA